MENKKKLLSPTSPICSKSAYYIYACCVARDVGKLIILFFLERSRTTIHESEKIVSGTLLERSRTSSKNAQKYPKIGSNFDTSMGYCSRTTLNFAEIILPIFRLYVLFMYANFQPSTMLLKKLVLKNIRKFCGKIVVIWAFWHFNWLL